LSKNKPVAESCFHCGLPVTAATICYGTVTGEKRVFCCSGCLTVCQVIHESGLDGFYQRLQYREATLAPPPQAPADIDQYDLVEVQQEFVVKMPDDSRRTQLLVEGIHCAACVWLIEKALGGMAGVLKAEVNLVHHRLLLQWRPEQVTLSAVMSRLAALGYVGVPFDLETVEGQLHKQNRRLLFRMGFAGFGAMNMMWISIALYAGAASGSAADYRSFFYWVSFAIATPVLLYSGGAIFIAALRGLKQGRLVMDLPITIGALATYSYSLWRLLLGDGEVYFDTVVTFLFVILIGRYLEARAKRNASSSTLRLLELQPRLANRLTAEGVERVVVRKLCAGDHLQIRPGDKVPADGVVLEGSSYLDESMLTGESKPVYKTADNRLIAGTVNGAGPMVMKVEQIGSNTVLARIIHLVETAQGSKAPVQRLADRIVPWFVVVTLLLATVTFSFWLHAGIETALLAATSVLIITCPCALGLATPMSIAVGSGLAARQGVLIRDGKALEGLSAVNHVVFDKTGTLTEGKMQVTDVQPCDDTAYIVQMAAAVEQHFSHPLAVAICDRLAVRDKTVPDSIEPRLIPGLGVSAQVDGHLVSVGNNALMGELGLIEPAALQQAAARIENQMGVALRVVCDHEIIGLIGIEDRLRSGSTELLDCLRRRGIGMTILTGDTRSAALAMRQRLGQEKNEEIKIIAGVLPEDKADVIQSLQAQGKRILMVGDGINDAPALARADISIAMGSGTDVSMECSDIVLMGSELLKIDMALALGQRTLRTVRQNLVLSLFYNILLVPAAMLAWVTPVFAALAMPFSSLLVIGNAIRIRWYFRGKAA